MAVVDIHTHILPGVDDGAESLEEAVEMVTMAAADGTSAMVATPHCNALYSFARERNEKLLAELRDAVGARMELALGCDFHLSYENLQAVLAGNRSHTVNRGPYLLVELADYALPPQLAESLHQLRVQSLIPIITHPERNPLLQRRGIKLLRQLIAMGCPLQITAGSLLGHFGRPARRMARELLQNEMVHVVASDAHDAKNRTPRLSEAYALVEQSFGAARAQALFADNPRAVTDGKQLPYRPEPAPPRRKRRFIFFGF